MKKQLFPIGALFFCSLVSFGKESYQPYIACYNSLMTTAGTWNKVPENMIICNTKGKVCYLFSPDEIKKFEIPQAKSYSKKNVEVLEVDGKEDIDFTAVSWGPSPAEKAELQYYHKMNGTFARNVSDISKIQNYISVTLTSVQSKEAIEYTKKILNINLTLIRHNLDTDGHPEDWTMKEQIKDMKKRIGGCLTFSDDLELKQSVNEVVDQLNKKKLR